jgi:methionyl-tRNA formyltransferase
MGAPDFAVPSLRALADAHEITLVLTRPDAVRGRGKALLPSPVKAEALRLGLPVLEASRITTEVMEALRAAAPDVACVVAYGCLLPDEVLALPAHGCVNVHGSLLPAWRGAAPIQRAILAGDERIGISIMRLTHAMDAGPYCRQASVAVGDAGCAEVMAQLAELGAQELLAALDDIERGIVRWIEQDESQVSFAAKIDKGELALDPADDALRNLRRVRASTDAAPARATVAGKGLRVLEARLGASGCAPGELLVLRRQVLLGCQDGSLELLQVKPDGKRAMDARSWAAGLRGDMLRWERA